VVKQNKTPMYSEDDDSFLGFIINDGTTWQAVTIFGYLIARTSSLKDAEMVLREEGPTYLKGLWQYFDTDDQDWFPCVIKKAHERMVVLNRTNGLGFQDPEDYKQVVIENPSEINLIKSN
jgi:hypothetical protein